MMRLSLEPLQLEPNGTRSALTSICEYAGGRLMWEAGATGAPEHNEDTILRLLCHFAISKLPSEAINEVWDTVYDQWQWHSQPRLVALPVAQPPIHVVNRVFLGQEEPPLQISED